MGIHRAVELHFGALTQIATNLSFFFFFYLNADLGPFCDLSWVDSSGVHEVNTPSDPNSLEINIYVFPNAFLF